LEITIEKLINSGEGLARHQGEVIFVPFSAPGDQLKVTVTEKKKNFTRAQIVEILKPGPGRREARCSHYGVCGGCNLQHIDYETRSKALLEAAGEVYSRIGGIEQEPQWVPSDQEWGYRNRVQFHPGQGGLPAFMQGHSHQVLTIQECPILVDALQKAIAQKSLLIPERQNYFAQGDRIYSGDQVGEADLRGRSLAFPVKGFFQSNLNMLEKTAAFIQEHVKGETFYDLYGGVGTFGALVSESFQHVVTVESYAPAQDYARKNIQGSNKVYPKTMEFWMKKFRGTFGPGDWVMVDPPRTGLSTPVRKFLLERKPANLVYLSCNPATHARDLKAFLAGGYKLDHLSVYDYNPQTSHLEGLALLSR